MADREVRQPVAITTLIDGPFQGRHVRILNRSRPVVIRENGKAAIYFFRSEGIHRYRQWCDIIDLDAKPPVPVREISMREETPRPAPAPARRRRSRWRRFWESLFPRPVRGSDG